MSERYKEMNEKDLWLEGEGASHKERTHDDTYVHVRIYRTSTNFRTEVAREDVHEFLLFRTERAFGEGTTPVEALVDVERNGLQRVGRSMLFDATGDRIAPYRDALAKLRARGSLRAQVGNREIAVVQGTASEPLVALPPKLSGPEVEL